MSVLAGYSCLLLKSEVAINLDILYSDTQPDYFTLLCMRAGDNKSQGY